MLSFKLQIGGFIVFFVLAILGPLLMFTPRMARAKRKGLADYGLLAQRYVESFEQKWLLRDPGPSEELLGAADIQALADLGNGYGLVREMRPVWPPLPELPSCLSYSQFSPQKNSSCASSRWCFEDASRQPRSANR